MPKKDTQQAHLLGVGLDNDDGHKRITQAEEFSIVGGSENTHERMTETVIKTFEDMKNDGKTLSNIEPEQLSDLLKRTAPPKQAVKWARSQTKNMSHPRQSQDSTSSKLSLKNEESDETLVIESGENDGSTYYPAMPMAVH